MNSDNVSIGSRMDNFNWDDLKFFLTLARAGNPMRGAVLLGVDHTTVRRRIAALEKTLDTRFFDRNGDQYLLTPQGEALLAASERMETEAISIQNQLKGSDSELSGTVRIGVPDALGSFFLAPCLVKLQRAHPSLRVELVATSRQFNLTKREADLSIAIERPAQTRHYIRKLVDCRLYLVASQAYLAQSPPIWKLADLRGHHFIGYLDQSDFNPELDPTSEIYQDLVRPRFASSNMVAQLRACVAGGGICLLPRYCTEPESTLVPILDKEFHIDRDVWFIIHSDLRNVTRFRTTTEFIFQEIVRQRHLFS